jgi:serine/threonine protein kinase
MNLYSWPIQAVEAVGYIHSKNVVHCDIGAHNFLIQDDVHSLYQISVDRVLTVRKAQ